MNSKQRRTLAALRIEPVRRNIAWADIESLLLALGATIVEREGSRIEVTLGKARGHFHRPHPRKEADPAAVRAVRRLIEQSGAAQMIISYRDYPAEVTLDLEAGIVSGRVLGIETPITFCAERVDEVEVRLAEAIDDYLRSCAERGEEPERPYSGHVEFYTSPQAHGRLVAAAARSGLSLDAWLEQITAAAAAAVLSRAGAA